MARIILADTGPLLAAISARDQYHARALDDLDRLARERAEIAVLSSNLTECYSLILHRLGVVAAHSWLDEIRHGTALVAPTVADFEDASALIFRFPDQSITLVDAVLAVFAHKYDLSVWTYDHHFDVMRVPVWR